MLKGAVYNNNVLAGYLEKRGPELYVFTYDEAYYADDSCPPVSLTIGKNKREHTSTTLFPFFAGLLAEGINKSIQCKLLRIDENDDFTRLLKTAGEDTIGAVTVREIK